MKSVLIIDDSYTARFLVKKVIKASGIEFDIKEASDGVEAYSFIRDKNPSPDFIITSLNLRRMSGITLLKKLRKSISFDNSKIIIISETGHEQIKKLLSGCPVAGVLKKPVAEAELIPLLTGGRA